LYYGKGAHCASAAGAGGIVTGRAAPHQQHAVCRQGAGNTGNQWYIAIIEVASGSINFFNSLTGCGNGLVSSTIKPLMIYYASSFEGSQLPMSWETVLQNTNQQTNDRDCGLYTIANSIHTVYAWDRMLQWDIPTMDEFRIRVTTLLATHTEDGFWKGLC
jgi:Ulp1 family protease